MHRRTQGQVRIVGLQELEGILFVRRNGIEIDGIDIEAVNQETLGQSQGPRRRRIVDGDVRVADSFLQSPYFFFDSPFIGVAVRQVKAQEEAEKAQKLLEAQTRKTEIEAKIAALETLKAAVESKPELEKQLDQVYEELAAAIQQLEAVQKAKEYEDLVDYVEGELREKHIERLAANMCKPGSGVVFLNLLTNLERISDHADNISGYVKHEIQVTR